MVEVVVLSSVTPLGRSKPTQNCGWLRLSVAVFVASLRRLTWCYMGPRSNLQARILVISVGLLVILSLISVVLTGGIDLLVLVPLSMFIGPFMYLAYPFSVLAKAVYVALLLAVVVGLIFGGCRIKSTRGQIVGTVSLVGWMILGLAGLSTGT